MNGLSSTTQNRNRGKEVLKAIFFFFVNNNWSELLKFVPFVLFKINLDSTQCQLFVNFAWHILMEVFFPYAFKICGLVISDNYHYQTNHTLAAVSQFIAAWCQTELTQIFPAEQVKFCSVKFSGFGEDKRKISQGMEAVIWKGQNIGVGAAPALQEEGWVPWQGIKEGI